MKQHILHEHSRQQGIALPTTMVILFLAAIAGLYAAKTSMTEQMVTADHYRSEQAFATGQAGVDAALKRHNDYPVDDAGVAVTADPMAFTLSKGKYRVMFCDIWDDEDDGPTVDSDGDGRTSASMMKQFLDDKLVCTNGIDNAAIDANGFKDDTRVGILSVGKPDDNSGRRTVSIVSAPARITKSDGKPSQPLISKSTVDITGTLNVINRYDDDTIWSAQAAEEYSSSVKTYINDGTIEPCIGEGCSNRLALVNPDATVDTLEATADKLGQNSDVLDDDNNLASVTEDMFFQAFFADTKVLTKPLFTVYEDLTDLNSAIDDGVTGLIWLDDPNLTGQITGDMGDCSVDPPVPVIFVVEVAVGDSLKFAGGNDICGIVFIFGDMDLAGSVTVSGAMISTGEVGGAGTFTIVYDPEAMTEPPEGFKGTRGVDAGTWKDWAVN